MESSLQVERTQDTRISRQIPLFVKLAISSHTISGFDQHRLKIEGCGWDCPPPTQRAFWAVDRFVRPLLPSNEYLSASERLCRIFMGILVASLQIFG
jgi:hypothetical protein